MGGDSGGSRTEAHGGYSLWIEGGAELRNRAVERFTEIATRFDADLVYADGKARIRGRTRAILRPDFSPLRLLEQDYLGDAILVRTSLLVEYSGTLSRNDLLEIAWRLDSASVVHIPEFLTSRPGPPPLAHPDARRAKIMELLDRAGIAAEVRPEGAVLRVVPVFDDVPLVSIIIPTRGSSAVIGEAQRILVVEAVRGIIALSTYPSFEIVVVADDETPQSVIDELVEVGGGLLTLVRWSRRFNFSGKINRGAAHAHGDFLLFLNDDIDVVSPDWIESMVGLCRLPGVGMVGANLVFENGCVQHAGHFYQARGAGHIAFGWHPDQDDAVGSLHVDREVSGVTAACAIVSRENFDRVGGFSNSFPGNYNDVDFSLKIRSSGARIVWTPWARLHHYESQTRDAATAVAEQTQLQARWGTRIEVDGYWSESISPITRPSGSH